jgi:hypothetical protein
MSNYILYPRRSPEGQVRLVANAADPVRCRTPTAIFSFWSPDGRSLGFFANGK